jgi:hypothetical protein
MVRAQVGSGGEGRGMEGRQHLTNLINVCFELERGGEMCLGMDGEGCKDVRTFVGIESRLAHMRIWNGPISKGHKHPNVFQ